MVFAILDQLKATAVTFTVAGNSGISSFLTLFLLGILERTNPELFSADGVSEGEHIVGSLLSTTPALMLTGGLTVVETLAMCVPIVDELTDSVMTLIVPVVSFLGSMSTMGLYPEGLLGAAPSEDIDGGRKLGAVNGMVGVLQCSVIFAGMCLALTMHFFKMLVRLFGEGWLTSILTIFEVFWCVCTLLLALFVKQLAAVIAAVFLVAAGWWFHHRKDRRRQKLQEQSQTGGNSTEPTESNVAAVEEGAVAATPITLLDEKAEHSAPYQAMVH